MRRYRVYRDGSHLGYWSGRTPEEAISDAKQASWTPPTGMYTAIPEGGEAMEWFLTVLIIVGIVLFWIIVMLWALGI